MGYADGIDWSDTGPVMNPFLALELLHECTGNDLWSIDHCKLRNVPAAWIEELAGGFESSYQIDSETIYVGDKTVNQYEGIRDVDLAVKLGEYLGVDTAPLQVSALTRHGLVRAIREAVEED
ncbi:MAG: hypothetical protein NTW52_13060 [Planctomycetota bacterium]|nr:hypothetical protein [Planctomycetota bacterium]